MMQRPLHGQLRQCISCRDDSRIKRICSAVLTGLFSVSPLLHPFCWDLHDVCCHEVKCKVIVLVLQPLSLFLWCNYYEALLACSSRVLQFSTRCERDKRKNLIWVASNVVMWPDFLVSFCLVCRLLGHWRLFSAGGSMELPCTFQLSAFPVCKHR